MEPAQHASLIIAHYLKHLSLRAGLRWTQTNDRDMETLAELLGASEEAQDSIPPFERPIVSDRVTQVFEHDGNNAIPDPNFQRWRGQQRYTEDDDVRRIVTRR